MPHDEHGNYFATMVTPSTPRAASRPPAKPESLCESCGRGMRGDGVGGPYHPGCEPGGYMEGLRVGRGGNQDTRGVVMNATEKDARPSPRPPLRRAQLIDGHAVTMTNTGMIVDGLEIIHEPTFAEANPEIPSRQKAHMFTGVEAHQALTMALKECHPVFRRAYLRLPNES